MVGYICEHSIAHIFVKVRSFEKFIVLFIGHQKRIK